MRKPDGYWTFDRCNKEAKKYKFKAEFLKNSSGAYSKCANNGWIPIVCVHMKYRTNIKTTKWNILACQQEAKKYKSLKDFQAHSSSAFTMIYRNKWQDLCFEHLYKGRQKWDYEKCKSEALKYNNKKEFVRGSGGAHGHAVKHGFLDKICSHMETLGHIYLRQLYVFEHNDKSVYVGLSYNANERYKAHMLYNDTLINKKHLNKQTFKIIKGFYKPKIASKKEQELVDSYKKRGWIILNKIKAGGLGGSKVVYWTLERCKQQAKLYNSRKEFYMENTGAQDAILKNGWKEIVFKHIPSKRALVSKREINNAITESRDLIELRRKFPRVYNNARNSKTLNTLRESVAKHNRSKS